MNEGFFSHAEWVVMVDFDDWRRGGGKWIVTPSPSVGSVEETIEKKRDDPPSPPPHTFDTGCNVPWMKTYPQWREWNEIPVMFPLCQSSRRPGGGWTFAASSSHPNHLAVNPRWMVPSDCHRPLSSPIVRLQAMGKYRLYLYLLKPRIYWMEICVAQRLSSIGRRPDGYMPSTVLLQWTPARWSSLDCYVPYICHRSGGTQIVQSIIPVVTLLNL